MAKYSIEDTTLTNIADAIRTKTGNSDSIMVQDMASEIAGIKGEPTLQTKTVTPSTSSQTITPDSGYGGLSQVTVNAMPTATQATPSITVSSGGLITAKATQSAGYVASGTKQSTKQLTTQAAKTITPSTSSQTAVASGRYTTGAVTVAGDANLKAENIKSGVSIFGVTGTASGSEDLDTELTTQESLISQLSTILDSKASGGSGGGSVETCTVNINFSYSINGFGILYATNVDSDGIYTYAEAETKSSGETVTINPLCNSIITIAHPVDTADCDAGTILLVSAGNGLVYQTPITNVVATINFEGV